MYLGLDLGTSSIKGVIIDEYGHVVAQSSSSLAVSRPHAGWSEQSPAAWINSATTVLHALNDDLPKVRAIGLAGQMHGATCLDTTGAVIRPAILWNDTRAHQEAAWLDQHPLARKITGNIVFAGFTAPKIVWMRKHEPENYARIATILLPKDYLRLWLTGESVTDLSDASGTAWLQVAGRCWSDAMLSLCAVSPSCMPRLVEGIEASGQLRAKITNKFGFASNITVAGGAGDNAASAVGLDIIKPGRTFISLGTSGVVFAASDTYRPDPQSALHCFCHCIPKTWHHMGVTLSATDCLNWFARQLETDPAKLTGNLGNTAVMPTAELFLPFLGGERTPYNNPNLRASFANIGHDTDRKALTRAVLEGVGFSLFQSLDLIEKKNNQIHEIVVVGGGAKSDVWLDILANICGRTIKRRNESEHAAAIGAARLAALSIAADFPISQQGTMFAPRGDLMAAYKQKYVDYLGKF